jgi:hypothetical protein
MSEPYTLPTAKVLKAELAHDSATVIVEISRENCSPGARSQRTQASGGAITLGTAGSPSRRIKSSLSGMSSRQKAARSIELR